MNKSFSPIGLVFLLSLSSCLDSSQPSSFSENRETSPKSEIQNLNNSPHKDSEKDDSLFPIEVGTIKPSEPRLFGCGTSLWETKTNPEKDGVLFSDRGGEPLMIFNSKIMNLKKTTTSSNVEQGNYGNFTTEDGGISVQVDFTIGELLDYETRSIPEGIITITTQEKNKKINVTGNTGC